jgi:hypothetical protein
VRGYFHHATSLCRHTVSDAERLPGSHGFYSGELFAPLADAQPGDTKILQTGKHPESADFGSKRAETAVGDSHPDRLPQVGHLFGCGIPEEVQCDVGLLCR